MTAWEHVQAAEALLAKVSPDRLSRAQMPLNEIGAANVHVQLAAVLLRLEGS